MTTCFAEGGDLFLVDDAGRASNAGRPGGYPVVWACPVPQSTDLLILYSYYRPQRASRGFQNLLRLNANLEVVWRAELAHGEDPYVHATLTDNTLRAASCGSMSVTLDLDTGRIVSQVWTK